MLGYTYTSPPTSDPPYMFIKGLSIQQGEISNVLAEQQRIPAAEEPQPLPDGPFIDPDKRCNDPRNGRLRRDVALYWMGDLDGDGRADFLLWASAYRSCALAILRWDPEHFLDPVQ
jgi:hypothetical protein